MLTQKNGNSPLMLAASAGSGRASDNNPDRVTEEEVVAAITSGLDRGLDINAANTAGDPVAHTASTTNLGSPGLIRFLHERGAKFDVKNKAGRTPLDAVLRAREKSDEMALFRQLTGVTGDTTPSAPAAASGAAPDNN